jgi:hypothetical protein
VCVELPLLPAPARALDVEAPHHPAPRVAVPHLGRGWDESPTDYHAICEVASTYTHVVDGVASTGKLCVIMWGMAWRAPVHYVVDGMASTCKLCFGWRGEHRCGEGRGMASTCACPTLRAVTPSRVTSVNRQSRVGRPGRFAQTQGPVDHARQVKVAN